MNESTTILKTIAIAIVRHLLSIVAAWLISKGIVAPEVLSVENLTVLAGGAAMGLLSLGLLVINKLRARNMVVAAMEAPAGTLLGVIEANASEKSLTEGLQ